MCSGLWLKPGRRYWRRCGRSGGVVWGSGVGRHLFVPFVLFRVRFLVVAVVVASGSSWWWSSRGISIDRSIMGPGGEARLIVGAGVCRSLAVAVVLDPEATNGRGKERDGLRGKHRFSSGEWSVVGGDVGGGGGVAERESRRRRGGVEVEAG